ncbi:N-acetyltransferase family protein [Azospirillum sp. sgz301742]
MSLGRISITVEAVIRPAEAADLPALEWMGLYTPHRSIIAEAFAAQQRGDGLMLLALTNGFPVGQVWIDVARKRAEGIAVLWAVRSFHPLHGAGIGRHLLEAAERELRRRGIRRAEIGVERSNDGARRLYERLGWRVVGPLAEVQRCVTPEGDVVEERLEEWLMGKDLGTA